MSDGPPWCVVVAGLGTKFMCVEERGIWVLDDQILDRGLGRKRGSQYIKKAELPADCFLGHQLSADLGLRSQFAPGAMNHLGSICHGPLFYEVPSRT